MALQDAIAAARMSKQTLLAVYDKLHHIVLQQLSDGENTDEESEEQTQVSSQITQQSDIIANLEAANSVVSSPTMDEINEVAGILNQVKNLAVEDAMLAEGRALLTQAASSAMDLSGKIKT